MAGTSQRVIKNTIWLMLQPLILNIVSIFVIGYIARSLGQADYGVLTFVFAFVTMFVPLTNMGLRAITVREVARDKEFSMTFLGKVFTLRLLLAFIAFIATIITINLLGYTQATKTVVYIYSLTIIFIAIFTTVTDIFQAHEKMEYIAYTQFISGSILTALSVLVIWMGYRLKGTVIVYTFGSMLSLIIAIRFLYKKLSVPKMIIDFHFWIDALKRGMPFFFPALISIVGVKIGIILLSKLSNDTAVGIYGAANNLVEKLVIIPDSICTAIFPAMVVLYQRSTDEAAALYEKFHFYLFLIGLPIATGTTILAKPIIYLVYGPQYHQSIPVLQILVWWLFGVFLTSLQNGVLGAIHEEKSAARTSYVVTSCYLVLNIILIRLFQQNGAAFASVIAVSMSFVILGLITRNKLRVNVWNTSYAKCLLADIIMLCIVYCLKEHNLLMAILIGGLTYGAIILAFGVIAFDDIFRLWSISVLKKGSKLDANRI